MSECFICGKVLSDGKITVVQKRGVQTLHSFAIKRGDEEHARMLEDVNNITVNVLCRKIYINERMAAAAIRRRRSNCAVSISKSPPSSPSSSQSSNHPPTFRPPAFHSPAFDFEKRCLFCAEVIDEIQFLTGLGQETSNVFFRKSRKGRTREALYSANSFKHVSVIDHIFLLHAFTGCDTTSAIYNIGKTKLINILEKNDGLREVLYMFKKTKLDIDVLTAAREKIFCEKPHGCAICRKMFSTSSSLNTHVRIYTGKRPHECPMCGKRFTAYRRICITTA
ncbi:hypothetical protein DBV15_10326 [Temnothorax longispinosus]|uniref:C2H2-type domain-containing protein n=1 Tax=Temnothorax longispinosus TaxID=300112 RepID=A0A4S2KV31_9HYME|nr:hypothetical protein DBV15_10326 [Temnothorax longispinosus]